MHTLAISSMLVLSEQNFTFGLHCVCSSNDHGRRVGLALQKAGDWNSRLFNICGFPLDCLIVLRSTNHSRQIRQI